jgi:hypothetical protein
MSDEQFVQAMQALHELGDQVAVPMKGGKSYVMVKDRIEIFRKEFGDRFGIRTEVDYKEGFDQGAPVVASAFILNSEGLVIASGWAVEFVGSTKLTDASPVEVAETSAIGRALACFGLHGGEYASLDEMQTHQRKEEFRAAPRTVAKPANGNGPDRPVEQKPMPSRWYVPTVDDWEIQPDEAAQNVMDEIDRIDTTHELGKYWGELKPSLDTLKKFAGAQDIIAEIKATFATRHNTVGSRK